MELNLLEFFIDSKQNGFHPVSIDTNHGKILCRYYHSPYARNAIIFLGGAGKDWDSPAKKMFPRMAEELMLRKMSSLQICYRHPADIGESTLDTLASIAFLRSQGIGSIGLVGHSFGAAVAIQTASVSSSVTTVVTMAAQVFGTDVVQQLFETPILLIHGEQDEVLPYQGSLYVHTLASNPKELVIYPNTGHGLHEASADVYEKVKSWLLQALPAQSSFHKVFQ